MDDGMLVTVSTLKAACATLLDHLEEVEGPNIRLDQDHFWSIAPTQIYDVINVPDDLTVGQLSECLEHITKIVEDPERSTSYALVWLAELLRAIGQTVVQ